MIRNLLSTFITERDPSRPAKDLARDINNRDLDVPSKEGTLFPSDFKHAHVPGQLASFSIGGSGMKPDIWSPGSENRGRPLMLLSAGPTSPPASTLAAHCFPHF